MLDDVDEQRNFPVQSQVLAEPEFKSKVLLREAAAKAFLEEHSKDTWRRALAGRNRPIRGPYQQGQLVYFFRKRARGLLSTRHGVWYGPGKVIGTESSSNNGVVPRVVWVAFNGFIYKCSPEGLRPLTEDEHQFRELAKSLAQGRLDPAIENAEQSLSSRCPQYQDLTNDIPLEDDEELSQDMEDYPDDGDSPDDNDDDGNSGPRKRLNSLDDDSGPRRVRLRITRSSDYWQKRARGMSTTGFTARGSHSS